MVLLTNVRNVLNIILIGHYGRHKIDIDTGPTYENR